MTKGTPENRVVVTGLGCVTPIGSNRKETWEAALAGRSGISHITQFDTTGCPCQIAGEVKGFQPTAEIEEIRPYPNGEPTRQALSEKDAKKMGRFSQLALVAGAEAYLDSGLDSFRREIPAERMGVNIGVGMGGLGEIEAVHEKFLEKGYRRITPFFIPQVIANLASGNLSILLNLRGPNLCNLTACSSSAHSLGEAYELLRRGQADVMVAGGSESVICKLGVGGFTAMKALSTRNEEPEKASRPFDVDRDGFVMGEGAAVLILERLEVAKKRGAKIYGEILGYGLSGDAHHVTLPAPEGEGGFRAMKMALESAGLSPEKVGYINTHGTSTPAGDVEEARAIARLFPKGPEHLHLSSTKSMTGHLLGAAGALEVVFSLLSTQENKIPPTINLDQLDPGCQELRLDFTANQAVEKNVEVALSNSFGFGGTNACVVVGKYLND